MSSALISFHSRISSTANDPFVNPMSRLSCNDNKVDFNVLIPIRAFVSFTVNRQMLDREGKREKILEGKLREIKIKLKKQQEQQEARASDLLARQAEKAVEEIKAQEEEPKVIIPSMSQGKQIIITLCRLRFFQCFLLFSCLIFSDD